MFTVVIVSLTLCPAWTAENENTAVVDGAATTDGGYHLYVPYLSYGEMEKRAQMGFQGMRGKKDDDLSSYLSKRASLGFHGMRGKKWIDQDDLDKRMAQGFHGMRGKKADAFELIPLLDQLHENYLVFDENEVEKRAMSGFHGMRGKKDVEMSKRAQQGFVGMRGKKSYEDADGVAKRAMGFHGMRGKKLNELGFKRAQQGFIGMRGKKGDLTTSSHDNEMLRSQGMFLVESLEKSNSSQQVFCVFIFCSS